jgi:hypothetical protein
MASETVFIDEDVGRDDSLLALQSSSSRYDPSILEQETAPPT